MTRKVTAFYFIFLMGMSSFADDFAVVCKDEQGMLRAEALALYELRTVDKLDPQLGGPELGTEGKIKLALEPVTTFELDTGSRLSQNANDFLKNVSEYLVDSIDVDVPVVDGLPPNCEVKPIIEQSYFNDIEVAMTEWSLLDNDSKVVLALHTAMVSVGSNYIEKRDYRKWVRALVGKMEVMQSAKPYAEFRGKEYWYLRHGLVFLPNKDFSANTDGSVYWGYWCPGCTQPAKIKDQFFGYGFIGYYENGEVRKAESFWPNWRFQLKVGESTISYNFGAPTFGRIEFYPSGKLAKWESSGGMAEIQMSYKLQDKLILFVRSFNFDSKERLTCGSLSNKAVLMNSQGRPVEFDYKKALLIDEQGFVRTSKIPCRDIPVSVARGLNGR